MNSVRYDEFVYNEIVKTETIMVPNETEADKLFKLLKRCTVRELGEDMRTISVGDGIFCAALPSKGIERRIFVGKANRWEVIRGMEIYNGPHSSSTRHYIEYAEAKEKFEEVKQEIVNKYSDYKVWDDDERSFAVTNGWDDIYVYIREEDSNE